jgi:1,4-dihydroxy-2-naphthoate octaprenyltransferase
MYSVVIMPVWVSNAIAFATTRHTQPAVWATFLLSIIFILAWENMSNDVFDAATGVDVNKANSLVNLTGNKSLIFWLANLFLTAGLLGISLISFVQKDFTVLGLSLVGCFWGYAYQGPPFRLGYQGLGEIICFFCFGPLLFATSYYSQTQAWSFTNLAASVVIGIATSLILFSSHFNQVEDDAAIGKKSPVVRLGAKRAAQLLPWFSGSIYAIILLLVILKIFPIWTLLALASLPYAIKLCRVIGSHYHQPETLTYCRFIAVALHFWTGLLFGLGFVL